MIWSQQGNTAKVASTIEFGNLPISGKYPSGEQLIAVSFEMLRTSQQGRDTNPKG
jgi:hypothetical protein